MKNYKQYTLTVFFWFLRALKDMFLGHHTLRRLADQYCFFSESMQCLVYKIGVVHGRLVASLVITKKSITVGPLTVLCLHVFAKQICHYITIAYNV